MADTINIPGVGPMKKQYVYAGIGITGGILIFAYWRRSAALPEDGGGTTVPEAVVPATTGDVGYDPYTQGSDGYGTTPTYYPGGSAPDYTGLTDAIKDALGSNTDTTGFSTNADWAAAAKGALTDIGVDDQAAAQTISLVLAGLQVTTAQQQQFLQAVGLLGAPPKGYPTIRVKDSAAQPGTPPVTGGTKPGAQLKAITGMKVTGTGRSSVSLDWNPVAGAKGYTVYVVADPSGGSTPTGRRVTTVLYSLYTVSGLKPNTRYRFDIHPQGSDGKNGPRARIYATTKK